MVLTLLCGYLQPTFSAKSQATKDKEMIISSGELLAGRGEAFSCFLEKRLRDEGSMHSFVDFTIPFKESTVEWVREDALESGMVYFLSSHRTKTIRIELVRYFAYRPPLGGVELKSLADVGGDFWVNLEQLGFRIDSIAWRVVPWIFSSSYFSSEPSLHIITQVSHVLIGDTKFNTCYHYVVFWVVVSIKSLDAFDGVVLKKPLDSSLIDWVTSEAVNLPAEDSFGFALFDILHHLGKDGTTWSFGRLGFFKNLHHVEFFSPGYFFHLNNLRLNRQRLPILALTRFSGVDNIPHTPKRK